MSNIVAQRGRGNTYIGNITQNIREILRREDIYISEAAAMAGIPEDVMVDYLAGHTDITMEQLTGILKALDVSMEELEKEPEYLIVRHVLIPHNGSLWMKMEYRGLVYKGEEYQTKKRELKVSLTRIKGNAWNRLSEKLNRILH